MILKQLFATYLLCLVTIATCMGQDGRGEVRGDLINDLDQSAVALHPSTPYLEPSTVLLAEIDLSKIDVDATMNSQNCCRQRGPLAPKKKTPPRRGCWFPPKS